MQVGKLFFTFTAFFSLSVATASAQTACLQQQFEYQAAEQAYQSQYAVTESYRTIVSSLENQMNAFQTQCREQYIAIDAQEDAVRNEVVILTAQCAFLNRYACFYVNSLLFTIRQIRAQKDLVRRTCSAFENSLNRSSSRYRNNLRNAEVLLVRRTQERDIKSQAYFSCLGQ